MSADIYAGWIVALIDGVWRHVRVAPGFATVAAYNSPNQHIGVFNLDDLRRPDRSIQATILELSRYALIGAMVINPETLDRIAWVRFGRIGRTANWGPSTVRTGPIMTAIADDHDDLRGPPPLEYDFRAPLPPVRWVRTARSLVVS